MSSPSYGFTIMTSCSAQTGLARVQNEKSICYPLGENTLKSAKSVLLMGTMAVRQNVKASNPCLIKRPYNIHTSYNTAFSVVISTTSGLHYPSEKTSNSHLSCNHRGLSRGCLSESAVRHLSCI